MRKIITSAHFSCRGHTRPASILQWFTSFKDIFLPLTTWHILYILQNKNPYNKFVYYRDPASPDAA